MPKYIDEDQIYAETNGGKTIFEHYFPTYEYGSRGKFVKLRADEKTASAQITLYQGSWRVTDFGNQQDVNSLKAISFVMWYENLNYYDSLRFIEEVILRRSVEPSKWTKPQWRADYAVRDMEPQDKKGEYNFTYKSDQEITERDLSAIGRYVTAELLSEYSCRVVKFYEYCTFSKTKGKDVVHKFIATDDYPIFVFDYGNFKKLYRPHDLDKKNRFSYVGDKPKHYIYGLPQLESARNEFLDEDNDEEYTPKDKPTAKLKDIFRCSGESDALNLASLGLHVYWLNSESAELTYSEYKQIDDMCQNHYQIMDLDATGQGMAMKNALKYPGLFTVVLPEWLGAKKDFRGNPCKDLKDFINIVGTNEDDTKLQFSFCKMKARKVKFWQKDPDKGTYNLNLEYFFFFLRANGFYQIDYRRLTKANYCYMRVVNKTVELIAPDDFKRIVKFFVKDWISSKNLADEIPILNKLNASNQLSEANLDSLQRIDISMKNYSANQEFLHFKNASLSITNDKVERVKRETIPNLVLGSAIIKEKEISHIIKREINNPKDAPAISVNATPEYQALLDALSSAKTELERESANINLAAFPDTDKFDVAINDKDFIFTSFLQDLSRLYWRKELEREEPLTPIERKEEVLTLVNIMFCLGYLCAQYKHKSKPWIVFFQDSKETEVGKSSGRSGKSLLSYAIKHTRPSFWIDGRTLDKPDNFKFLFDGFTEFHDVIEVDDFAEFGDFQFFYTQATGSRTVNCKHTSPFTLDYEDSGKLFISTNFEMQNTDSSTMARILNCGVSDYYHQKTDYNDYKQTRSPDKKFGKLMYDDFTDEEWNKFYHFIAYCVQLQMRFDRIDPPKKFLERRQLRRAMASGLGRDEEFLQWANDYFKHCDKDTPLPDKSSTEWGYVYFDTLFDRAAAYAHFVENAGISGNKKNAYSPQKFKTHLTTWVKYNGYILNPENMCSGTPPRIMKKEDGRTVEYFYIKTGEENNIEENPQIMAQLPF